MSLLQNRGLGAARRAVTEGSRAFTCKFSLDLMELANGRFPVIDHGLLGLVQPALEAHGLHKI